jgi:hypothetical protein
VVEWRGLGGREISGEGERVLVVVIGGARFGILFLLSRLAGSSGGAGLTDTSLPPFVLLSLQPVGGDALDEHPFLPRGWRSRLALRVSGGLGHETLVT